MPNRRNFNAAALAGLLGTCGAPSVRAQAPGLVAAPIAGILAGPARIELVNAGFLAPQGPLGLPDGSLIFTEARAHRINRVAPDGSLSVAIEGTEGATSLAYGTHGDLYAVHGSPSRVGVIFPPQRRKVLADRIDGRPFGAAGDLVLSQLGHLYVTDPGRDDAASAPPALYRISARSGPLQRLADGLRRPRGVQLSPDERTLYVSEAAGEHVLAFDLAEDGIRVGPARPFARLSAGAASDAGGLAIDLRGRLYVATAQGVQIFSPGGAALGTIVLPQPARNLAFAGPGKRTLFVLGDDAVYRIATGTAGYPGRAK